MESPFQSLELGNLVVHADAAERATFYRKTYLHVALAVLAFIGVEALLLNTPGVVEGIFNFLQISNFMWLAVLGVFWIGSTIAEKMSRATSRSTQYLGLGLYVILEAIIFLPLIFIAIGLSDGENLIMQAAIMTFALFSGLSAIVFITNTNFSFLKTALTIGTFLAFGIIIAGMIFGFNLGLWFSVGMVVLATGAILYQTSQLKYEYQTDQYVGAALGLFASLMLLFWYILRIFMSRD